MKRSRINQRSRKRVSDDKVRAELRLAFLADHPACELCRRAPATDVDELIGRGVLPGAQLLPELFQALCRTCHRMKTDQPDWAYRHGWSAHSWDLDRVAFIRSRRARCELSCSVDHLADPDLNTSF